MQRQLLEPVGRLPVAGVVGRLCGFFFFNDTATTEVYTSIDTLSLQRRSSDLLSHSATVTVTVGAAADFTVTASPTSRSEEHTSELQSPIDISYAVFCLKKK